MRKHLLILIIIIPYLTPNRKPQTPNPKLQTPNSEPQAPNPIFQTCGQHGKRKMTNPMLPTRCSCAPTFQTPIKQEYIYDIQAHVEHKVFIPRPITDASHWCNMSKCMPFKLLLSLTSCSITSRIIVVVCIIVNVCNCLFLQHVQVTPNYTIKLWGCIIVP